jgi:hypothetical protein
LEDADTTTGVASPLPLTSPVAGPKVCVWGEARLADSDSKHESCRVRLRKAVEAAMLLNRPLDVVRNLLIAGMSLALRLFPPRYLLSWCEVECEKE